MSNGGSADAAQLGAIALATNNHPKGASSKLDSVGTDPDERFYMLATFCFDLSRKLKYISLALKPYWDKADPELAKRILDDNEFINPEDPEDLSRRLPWKDMAHRSEDVMKKLWSELHDGHKHHETLKKCASRAKGKGNPLKARGSYIKV
jgi:hypothetical protein